MNLHRKSRKLPARKPAASPPNWTTAESKKLQRSQRSSMAAQISQVGTNQLRTPITALRIGKLMLAAKAASDASSSRSRSSRRSSQATMGATERRWNTMIGPVKTSV